MTDLLKFLYGLGFKNYLCRVTSVEENGVTWLILNAHLETKRVVQEPFDTYTNGTNTLSKEEIKEFFEKNFQTCGAKRLNSYIKAFLSGLEERNIL